jgi:peptidoglycan/xylan/chitin deacetylase (PgdA/CDA1 family)
MSGSHWPRPEPRDNRPMRAILTYHSIDASGSPISCHPDTFARQVQWLASGRVKVASIDELLRLPDTADAVALTFDDGFANFEEQAAPRLMDHGFPVTIFVVAERVGDCNSWDAGPRRRTPDLPLLDWPALIRLQDRGVTLGAHSLTHRSLPGLSPGDLEAEVQGSADIMEDRSGRRPTTFAYPYGHHDSASRAVVSRAFPCACTTEFQPLSVASDLAALPRLDMHYFERPGSLDAWGTPRFAARISVRNRLRRFRQGAAVKFGRQ